MKKKVAIITGASEGLGKAISIRLASKKYITVLASRDKKKLQNTSSDISKVNGEYFIIPTDITSEKNVKTLFSKASKLGKIELLINNAGVGTFNKVKEITAEFSKKINREIFTLSTLEKSSVSKIKAKLISYVS